MTIGERIRLLRKNLDMNQNDFGKKIGLASNTITNYETDRRNPSNQVIELICRVFNINENWLRTGEGKMFLEIPEEDEYFKAATEISKSNDKLAMQILIEYWKLDENGKKLLKDFILHIAEKSKE
ncbi:MAG: transcriptional regulator [Lachnospiraceae bacterium]|nr:transcriptional regulator [Lachnospiraceae bacterium]